MLIEQPPLLYRLLFPEAIWRIKHRSREKTVFLTFDDGPIPEVTPWVLDLLDSYGIKATFFMVGDNVRRHPELYAEVRRPEKIKVEYYNENFEKVVEEFDRFACRMVQHELSHLEGNLFVDNVSPIRRKMIARKLMAISKGTVQTRYKSKR